MKQHPLPFLSCVFRRSLIFNWMAWGLAGALLMTISQGCKKEFVTPNDEVNKNADIVRQGENVVQLRSGTHMITEDVELIKIDSHHIWLQEHSDLENIKVGDVIFAGSSISAPYGYMRQVINRESSGNRILFETMEATLADAFSYYYLNSKSEKTKFSRSGDDFKKILEFKIGNFKVGGSGELIPDFVFDFSLDTAQSQIIITGDSSSLTSFDVLIDLKDFAFTGHAGFRVNGSFSGKFEAKIFPAPIRIFQFGPIPIAVFLDAKGYVKGGFKGEVALPGLDYNFGPQDIYVHAGFDGEEFVVDPLNINSPLMIYTTPFSVVGEIGAEIGLESKVYIGPSDGETIKLGFSAAGYADAKILFGGNFYDRIPSISTKYSLGIGTKLFLELLYFSNNSDQYPLLGRIPFFDAISGKIEYPFDKIPLFEYSKDINPDCGIFGQIEFEPICEEGIRSFNIMVPCNTCLGQGYNLFIDGIKSPRSPLLYSTQYNIVIENDSSSHSIWVQDNESPFCILRQGFYDPCGLNYDCVEMVVDDLNNEYCVTEIGGQQWMAQNLRIDNGMGVCYDNVGGTECFYNGRLYTFDEVMNGEEPNAPDEDRKIRGICPVGFHIPTIEEWRTLIQNSGGASAHRNLKTNFPGVWDNSDLPSSSKFHAFPSGEYYKWLQSSQPRPFGALGRKTTFWTSTRGSNTVGSITSNGVFVIIINNLAISDLPRDEEDASSSPGVQSIDHDLGYSCRCIKD